MLTAEHRNTFDEARQSLTTTRPSRPDPGTARTAVNYSGDNTESPFLSTSDSVGFRLASSLMARPGSPFELSQTALEDESPPSSNECESPPPTPPRRRSPANEENSVVRDSGSPTPPSNIFDDSNDSFLGGLGSNTSHNSSVLSLPPSPVQAMLDDPSVANTTLDEHGLLSSSSFLDDLDPPPSSFLDDDVGEVDCEPLEIPSHGYPTREGDGYDDADDDDEEQNDEENEEGEEEEREEAEWATKKPPSRESPHSSTSSFTSSRRNTVLFLGALDTSDISGELSIGDIAPPLKQDSTGRGTSSISPEPSPPTPESEITLKSQLERYTKTLRALSVKHPRLLDTYTCAYNATKKNEQVSQRRAISFGSPRKVIDAGHAVGGLATIQVFDICQSLERQVAEVRELEKNEAETKVLISEAIAKSKAEYEPRLQSLRQKYEQLDVTEARVAQTEAHLEVVRQQLADLVAERQRLAHDLERVKSRGALIPGISTDIRVWFPVVGVVAFAAAFISATILDTTTHTRISNAALFEYIFKVLFRTLSDDLPAFCFVYKELPPLASAYHVSYIDEKGYLAKTSGFWGSDPARIPT
ncbi:hypothetical protein DFJ77DRAFT_439670 [Powellomyces hirtus]|nr:hypothetical protein DFJ77DRAFT_439670 [Powellomyces hirtus]